MLIDLACLKPQNARKEFLANFWFFSHAPTAFSVDTDTPPRLPNMALGTRFTQVTTRWDSLYSRRQTNDFSSIQVVDLVVIASNSPCQLRINMSENSDRRLVDFSLKKVG